MQKFSFSKAPAFASMLSNATLLLPSFATLLSFAALLSITLAPSADAQAQSPGGAPQPAVQAQSVGVSPQQAIKAQSSGDAQQLDYDLQPFPQDVSITEEEIIQAQREFLCKRFLEDAKEEMKNGFHGKAEAYLNEAVNLAQQLKKNDQLLIAYRERGRFYRDLKMPEHARQSFAKAYEIFVRQLKEVRRKGKNSTFWPSAWTEKYSDLLAEYGSLLDSLGQSKLAESVQSLSMKIDLDLAESRVDETRPIPAYHHQPGAQIDIDYGPYIADIQRS